MAYPRNSSPAPFVSDTVDCMKSLWHRLLCFLAFRNDFDWAPPGLGPEVNHPYFQADALRCCNYCGGGPRHAIHSKPYDKRRAAEVIAREVDRNKSRYERAIESWMAGESEATNRPYVEREH